MSECCKDTVPTNPGTLSHKAYQALREYKRLRREAESLIQLASIAALDLADALAEDGQ
jgi:hypothetical protein